MPAFTSTFLKGRVKSHMQPAELHQKAKPFKQRLRKERKQEVPYVNATLLGLLWKLN